MTGGGKDESLDADCEPREVRLLYEGGDSESALVTRLGANRYRLEENLLLGEATYHDVLEADAQADGTLRYLRVAEPSGLKTESWILSKALIESPQLTKLLGRVDAAGGRWERVFGGVLFVSVPPTSAGIIDEISGLRAKHPENRSEREAL
jgi:hypothetical protein